MHTICELYAYALMRAPNRNYEFRMTQIRGWNMTNNSAIFRKGASALRNTRDEAKEKREELIITINDKVLDTKYLNLILSI